MLSNPLTILIGNDQFEYREANPGKYPYHFSPYENGLSTTMEWNVILFADSSEHALEILGKVFKWAELVYVQKAENYAQNPVYQRHSGYLYPQWKRVKKYRKALAAGKITVSKAPIDQLYKVGWATNDTV